MDFCLDLLDANLLAGCSSPPVSPLHSLGSLYLYFLICCWEDTWGHGPGEMEGCKACMTRNVAPAQLDVGSLELAQMSIFR